MKKHLFILCMFSYSMFAFAQTTISGKISDKNAEPLSDIMVTLLSAQDSSVVAFSSSDASGGYEIKINSKEPEFLLSITGFEIERQTKKIANRTQTVNFTAEAGGIELREIVVESKKIWGEKDTINYSVSAFKDKKDVVIADVLKKMPGISVAESGQISYQGKPINKFYIEGMDMLQGRYGVATNNVSADDVATVQVLENHQPIKALETTKYSTDAAINLKIRNDRKGIFTATAITGLGYHPDLLWHGELNGMYFGKGFQHISTYKADNAGNNIGRELNSFYSQGGIGGMQMTGLLQPSAPGIRHERYNFNDSHAATLNNLKKLKDDAELNFNLIFSNDRNYRHGFTRTGYILPGDSMVTVSEDISTNNRSNRLETELRYSKNKQNDYFNNYLNVSAGWNDGTGEIITANTLEQAFENRAIRANNATHWIKTKEDGRGFELTSVNSVISQPHSLSVSPGLYPDIFNNEIPYHSIMQRVQMNGFASNNRFSLLTALMLGNVRINPAVSVNLERRTFETGLELTQLNREKTTVADTEMRNDLGWTRLYSAFDLGAGYSSEAFKFNISLPLGYNHTLINSAFSTHSYKRDKIYFQPSASASYTFLSNWQLTANYAHGINSPGLNTLYTGYILTNYRSLNRYDTRIFDTRSQNSSLGISYKDIISMFFFNAGVSTNHYRSDAMYGQILDSVLTITTLKEQPNSGNSLSVNGQVSKGFNWKALVIKANAGWGQNTAGQLRQDKLVDYNGQWISAGGALNMKMMKWLFAEYAISWGQNKGKVSTGETFPVMQSLNQKGTITAELPFGIGINGTYEHYYNNALPMVNRNFSFADLGMTYVIRRTRFLLSWTNILNTSKFITSSYGNLNTYYAEYDIRPAQIMLSVRFRLK